MSNLPNLTKPWNPDGDEWESRLDELLELDEGELSDWEVSFVDNLDQNFRERGLSEKQQITLLKIHDRIFG